MNILNRRQFLSLTAGGTVAAMLPLTGCESQLARGKNPAKRPNIIFIMVDDLGPEWLSCCGGQEMKTPNRDKQYKLWVLNGKSAKLFDLLADPAETNNLIDGKNPKALAALRKLEAVVRSFPPEDARPKYDPTPPQPWDKKPN